MSINEVPERPQQKGDTKGDLFERLLSRRQRSLKKQTLVANNLTGRNAPVAAARFSHQQAELLSTRRVFLQDLNYR